MKQAVAEGQVVGVRRNILETRVGIIWAKA